MASSRPIAVIADVVRSRSYEDRDALQRQIERALAEGAVAVPTREAFAATVGDEFQAVYDTLPRALAGTLHIQLGLPEGAALRFGLGRGEVRPVASRTGRVQDGPGWWRAREAIEALEAQEASLPSAHSRFAGPDAEENALVNAYLLARDQLLAGLNVRARRYARHALEGRSQADIAAELGVTQPAVSQALRRPATRALLEGAALFTEA
ncbi:SatD family protein [Sediminivirga luteola]|uniref:SatD family protein n=1 Tax=Sediminivirga luteola TaxID=1774748 RepID=A0A8J2XL89_9MICO|nr:SatD family protein [Sediminivirga luteola]GGA20029.1 hypothetical protein GCM10011333_23960 [Sediminivirga luteola]